MINKLYDSNGINKNNNINNYNQSVKDTENVKDSKSQTPAESEALPRYWYLSYSLFPTQFSQYNYRLYTNYYFNNHWNYLRKFLVSLRLNLNTIRTELHLPTYNLQAMTITQKNKAVFEVLQLIRVKFREEYNYDLAMDHDFYDYSEFESDEKYTQIRENSLDKLFRKLNLNYMAHMAETNNLFWHSVYIHYMKELWAVYAAETVDLNKINSFNYKTHCRVNKRFSQSANTQCQLKSISLAIFDMAKEVQTLRKELLKNNDKEVLSEIQNTIERLMNDNEAMKFEYTEFNVKEQEILYKGMYKYWGLVSVTSLDYQSKCVGLMDPLANGYGLEILGYDFYKEKKAAEMGEDTDYYIECLADLLGDTDDKEAIATLYYASHYEMLLRTYVELYKNFGVPQNGYWFYGTETPFYEMTSKIIDKKSPNYLRGGIDNYQLMRAQIVNQNKLFKKFECLLSRIFKVSIMFKETDEQTINWLIHNDDEWKMFNEEVKK